MSPGEYPMRINKYLAHAGVATRRDADALIARGLVKINGRVAVLGDKVEAEDAVEYKGLRTKAYRYYAYHKPVGVVTHSPTRGEASVRENPDLPRGVFPVGRLDKASHGLLILTDDGRVTERLLGPDHEHDKEYRVQVREPLLSGVPARFARGLELEGERLKPVKMRLTGDYACVLTLTEGKKHQIRRMFSAVGNVVTDLCRVRILNIRLGALAPGDLRPIEGAELDTLLTRLGLPSAARRG